jgi:hypothetical protein
MGEAFLEGFFIDGSPCIVVKVERLYGITNYTPTKGTIFFSLFYSLTPKMHVKIIQNVSMVCLLNIGVCIFSRLKVVSCRTANVCAQRVDCACAYRCLRVGFSFHGTRWIGRGGPFALPTLSPDVAVMDIF